MSNITYSFLLTTLAGLSTMIGTIPIFFKTKNSHSIVTKSLAFASGVMITVSLLDLIPESHMALLNSFKPIYVILLSIIGILVGMICSSFIEHCFPNTHKENEKLYKVGLISMIAILFHNLPEGIATFMTSSHNLELGITLAIAIALHNIPEGITISIPIYYATHNRKKAIFYTFLSGISELMGAILAFAFLRHIMTDSIMGMLYAMIAGIMISISFRELLPTSLQNNKILSTLMFFFIGVGVMLLSHKLL